jgi:DNA-binding NarL/FixJ family response regulator
VRVVIGEDDVLLREGLARLLADAGIEVVAQAGDADDLRRRVRGHRPDVVVADIRMPPDNTDDGVRAVRQLRQEQPGLGVLVLSAHVDQHYAQQLLAGGADGVGYLLKERIVDVERFVDAVRRVAAGGSALDPEVVHQVVAGHTDWLSGLTAREREVLELMAEGLSNRGIGAAMVVTDRAVERHITNIFGKLGLGATGSDHRRVLAVLAYLQVGRPQG